MTIYLGTGNGNFGFGAHFATGANPTDICVADINADGRDDIVVCNNSSGTISVLMGNGAGGFGGAVNYVCGGAPTSVVLADVNLDGRLDAVVATGENIAILRGAPGGTFLARVTVAGSSSSRNVTVGDVNSDGKPDLVMVSYNNNTLSVFLGNGTTDFAPLVYYETDAGPVVPVIADINRDGTPDIIVGHGQAPFTRVFLGTGGGAFEPSFRVNGGGGSEVVVDINSDGFPDIVGSRQSTDAVLVITQNPAPVLPGIATQPTSRSVLAGQSTEFAPSLSPSDRPQTIRWRRNGVPLVNNAVCSGVTTPTLTINGATMADNGARLRLRDHRCLRVDDLDPGEPVGVAVMHSRLQPQRPRQQPGLLRLPPGVLHRLPVRPPEHGPD